MQEKTADDLETARLNGTVDRGRITTCRRKRRKGGDDAEEKGHKEHSD